jgi:PQQ-like domain
VRACIALVALSIALPGCSGERHAASNRSQLAVLTHLTADQANFGVILDAKTGRALAAFRVNNPIRAAIPDGMGGWYIGGGFINVNGVLRKRLAHIDANGMLDRDWKPEANGNGVSVTSLARAGSRLYVGGDFVKLQHKPRLGLGALDIRTGRLEAWRARIRAEYSYDALIATGGRLIAGGTACCSEAGSSVVGLDASDGGPDTSWRPHVGKTTLYGHGVYMLPSGDRAVLIRGLYIHPPDRVAVGELDEKTGRLARRWTTRMTRTRCLWCQLMAAAVGEGKVFATVNGSSRYSVVSFSRQTGALDPHWHARISAVTGFYGGTSANSILVAGRRVYVTGDFDRINGAHRNGFAALDRATARVLPSWQPRAAWVYGSLLALSRHRLLVAIGLARQLRFNLTGLKTDRPVRTLRLVLALSGPGRVRIGLGRGCDLQTWLNSLRCSGHVVQWLSLVRFDRARRKRYARRLRVAPGRYFVHFVPQSPKGVPQTPQDFPITIPPPKVRSTFGG